MSIVFTPIPAHERITSRLAVLARRVVYVSLPWPLLAAAGTYGYLRGLQPSPHIMWVGIAGLIFFSGFCIALWSAAWVAKDEARLGKEDELRAAAECQSVEDRVAKVREAYRAFGIPFPEPFSLSGTVLVNPAARGAVFADRLEALGMKVSRRPSKDAANPHPNMNGSTFKNFNNGLCLRLSEVRLVTVVPGDVGGLNFGEILLKDGTRVRCFPEYVEAVAKALTESGSAPTPEASK